MKTFRSMNPVLRATGVIGTVAALVTGITFAALSSQATLTANTIASATADLQVNNTDNAGAFGATDTGYAFTGIIPGGAGSNVGNFQLKNNGTATLSLKLSVSGTPVCTAVPAAVVPTNKIHVLVQRGAGAPLDFLLSDLVTGPVALTGGNLNATLTETDNVQVKMDVDAFTGSSASCTAFNFVFDGAGV